jgi:hypothetical protein
MTVAAPEGFEKPCPKALLEHFSTVDPQLRDELLDGEIFYTLEVAKVVIEGWRRHYTMVRPHSPLVSPTRSGGGRGASYAPRTRFAGHAGRSANARHSLTFQLNHP